MLTLTERSWLLPGRVEHLLEVGASMDEIAAEVGQTVVQLTFLRAAAGQVRRSLEEQVRAQVS